MLRRGDNGDAVRELQAALDAAGYDCLVDGDFGPHTEACVRAIQRRAGLTPDGIAGPLTWAELRRARLPQVSVEGVDVSGWQRTIDWERLYRSGRRFVYVKATEGDRHLSSGLARHWLPSWAAGFSRGLYHFARLGYGALDKPLVQARFFAEQIAQREADLPPALDLEAGGIPRSTPSSAVVDWAIAWLEEVERLTGVEPIVYTGHWTWLDRLDMSQALFRWRLWQADCGRPSPIPGWPPVIVQYDVRGRVPGYSGHVDLNRTTCSLDELRVTP